MKKNSTYQYAKSRSKMSLKQKYRDFCISPSVHQSLMHVHTRADVNFGNAMI